MAVIESFVSQLKSSIDEQQKERVELLTKLDRVLVVHGNSQVQNGGNVPHAFPPANIPSLGVQYPTNNHNVQFMAPLNCPRPGQDYSFYSHRGFPPIPDPDSSHKVFLCVFCEILCAVCILGIAQHFLKS